MQKDQKCIKSQNKNRKIKEELLSLAVLKHEVEKMRIYAYLDWLS
jgi:hypothetical protein